MFTTCYTSDLPSTINIVSWIVNDKILPFYFQYGLIMGTILAYNILELLLWKEILSGTST